MKIKHRNRFRFLLTLLPAWAAFFLLLRGAAVLFFRSLGRIVLFLGSAFELGETAETLGRIFGQLASPDQAQLSPPILVPLLCALLSGLLICLGVKSKKPPRIVLSCVGALILLILAALLTCWLTSVNGIRFDGVVLSLIRLIQAGALDSL